MRRAVPHTVRTVDHLREVADFYANVDEFVFDVETVGKNRGHPKLNRVTWLGLTYEDRTDVIPMGHPRGELVSPAYSQREPWWDENDLTKRGKPKKKWRAIRYPAKFTATPSQLWPADVWEALEPAFFGPAKKIGHGVKFDLLSIAKYYDGRWPEPPYGDSLILAHLLNSNLKYGLKDLTKRLYDHDYDKENIAKPDKYGENGIEIHPFSKAARYTSLDVKYTWLIYHQFREALHKRGHKNLDALEHDVLEALLPMESTGILVDVDAMVDLGKQLSEERIEIEKRIFAASGRVWDLNSTQQKQQFVYEDRGHEPFRFTPKSCEDHLPNEHHKGCTPSTEANVLEVFAADDPIVADLLDYATVQKLVSTYTGWQNDDNTFEGGLFQHIVDGRIHTDLVQYGADTGRFSSRRPNLQNIPARSEDERAKLLRKMFISDPGHSFIVADYGQIEYRVLAALSRDPTLLKAFREGWDPHAAVMAMILEKPVDKVTKEERDQGKSINFASIYGAGPAKIATMAKVSLKRAKWIRSTYEERSIGVQKWKKKVIRTARDRKPQPYVETILGRRRWLPALWSAKEAYRFSAERQAINTVVQGSAADIIKIAMVKLHQALPEHSTMLLQVHDELIVQSPDRHAEEVRELVSEVMESVDLLDGVSLEAEAHVGKSWSEAK